MTREIINKHIEDTVAKEPRARLLANKYKTIRNTIMYKYPKLNDMGKDMVEAIIDDAIHLDRYWRRLTEDDDKENKEIARQEWIVDNIMKY